MTRFDRIETGEALPLLQTDITREDLVRYAGGADDYVRQHWDHPFMIESGFPDVVVHGWLTFAHMCRAVEAWLTPEEARIAQFSVRYLAPTYPGPLSCGGEVVSRQCDSIIVGLWASDVHGNRTTRAEMTLVRA
jgi:acyl dehydratase